MTVICTVRIPHSLAKVQAVEEGLADTMQGIVAAATKYMTGHRRIAADSEVIDLDEFASEADYEAFIAEAGPFIQTWNDALGTPAQDTVYTVVEGA